MSHHQDTDTRNTAPSVEFRHLGYVPVDSARIAVVDPCHVPGMAELAGMHDVDLGVITGTAHGDGLFPVTLELRNGLPRRLVVELDEDGEQFTTIEGLVSEAARSAIEELATAFSAARRGGYDDLAERIATRLDLLTELTLPEPTDADHIADALNANTDNDGTA